MLFRSKTAAKTWDSWIYYHESRYYLYYLVSREYVCDGFALAISSDGVHWHDQGLVFSHSDEMVRYLGGGNIWLAEGGEYSGDFICNYSEWHMEEEVNVQRMFFARSRDLVHWERLPEETVFKVDERYYKRIEPEQHDPWDDPRWDGISVISKPQGGYFGYWTAMPNGFRGFGFGESEDGVHWRALPAPKLEWGKEPEMRFIEVGGVFQMDGQVFAMLADYASNHCGMFAFQADSPYGPFHPAEKNFGLMLNRSKMHAYFSRFLDSPTGLLVNHHTLAKGQLADPEYTVYYAPCKRVLFIDNVMHLAWWEGNELLKHEPVLGMNPQEISFHPERGVIVEGVINSSGKVLISRTDGETTYITVDEEGVVRFANQSADPDEWVDRELHFRDPRFTLLVNQTMIELYLNGIFIQCYTMDAPASGKMSMRNAKDLRMWYWDQKTG